MRQLQEVWHWYEVGKGVQGRCKGCKLGMRQVQGVQGSHKASTRDAI